MKKLFLILVLTLVLISLSYNAYATRIWIIPDPAFTENDLKCNIEGNPDPNYFRFKWFQNGVLKYDQQGMDTLGNVNTYVTDTWKCEVRRLNNQYEGESQTVSISNRNPSVTSISVSPSSPNTDENLLCSITVADPDNDPNGNLDHVVITWIKGGQTIRTQTKSVSGIQASVTDTLTASQTGVGDQIKCSATVYDKRSAQASGESQVTVINRNPSLNSISITPQNPTKENDLTCSASASDPDGSDPQGYLDRIVFEWSKNNQVIRTQSKSVSGGAASESDMLSHTNLNPADVIKCKATVYDKKSASASQETQVTVQNRPPVASNVQVTPASPKTNDDLTCTYQYSDPDGDPEGQTEFSWYKNGVNQNVNSKVLSNSLTTKGEQWYCKVRPKDSHGAAGDEVQSNSVVIQNSPPQFSGPIPDQTWSMNTQKRLELRPYFTDADGDRLQYSNSPALVHITTRYDETGVLLTPQNNWYGSEMTKFSASDGEASAYSNFVTLTVTRVNQPPIAVLSAEPTNVRINENVKFDGSGSYDPDGFVQYYYYEYGNGQNSGWVSGNFIYYAYPQIGVYYAKLKVRDNSGAESGWSTTVMINVTQQQQTNRPPHVDSISLTPQNPTPQDDITCAVVVSDPDANLREVRFEWYKNEVRIRTYVQSVSGGSARASDTLVAGQGQAGDTIKCVATARDLGGLINSAQASVVIRQQQTNRPPVVSSVLITPRQPTPMDNLICTAQVSDPDSNLDYIAFKWYRNNELVRTINKGVSGGSATESDTLPYTYLRENDVIRCDARVYDTQGAYADGYDSVTVGSGQTNQPPVAVLWADPVNVQRGYNVRFDGSQSYDPDGTVVSYYFDYGNGQNSGWVSGNFIYYAYPQIGVYYAKLKVRDNSGAESGWSASVRIDVYEQQQNQLPVAVLTAQPTNVRPYMNVKFDGSGSYDPDGVVTIYYFDYGDGQNSGWTQNSYVYHSYQQVGTYFAKLKVKDNRGAESAWSPTVTITVTSGQPPSQNPHVDTIQISPADPDEYDDLECAVSVSDSNGDLGYVTFKWSRNNAVIRTYTRYVNGYSDTSTDTLSYLYTEAGDLIECNVIVYDRAGHTDEDRVTVTIGQAPVENPVAVLYADPTDPDVGESVKFDGSQSYDSDGEVVSYYFEFGDGSFYGWTSSPQTYHTYRDDGTYYARLKVKDNEGHVSDWNTVTIEVGNGHHHGGGDNPVIEEVSITPSYPYEDDDLTCRVNVYDDDGDLDYVRFRWYVEGDLERIVNKDVSGYDDYVSDILDESYTDAGDSVECEATVYDHDDNWDTENDYVNIRSGFGGSQEDCSVSITEFDYSQKITSTQSAWIKGVVKNYGSTGQTVDLKLYVDGSLKNTYSEYLSSYDTFDKTFYVSTLVTGTHSITLEAYARCGNSAKRYGTITVGKTAVSTVDVAVVNPPEEPAPESKIDTVIRIYPTPLEIELGQTDTIYVDMQTPFEQTFYITVTGVPSEWVSYQNSVLASDVHTAYINVEPQVLGNYVITVTVKALDKNKKEITVSKDINLYVAQLKTHKMVFGEAGLDETLTGLISALGTNWVTGAALLAIVVAAGVVLHFGRMRLKRERKEDMFGI